MGPTGVATNNHQSGGGEMVCCVAGQSPFPAGVFKGQKGPLEKIIKIKQWHESKVLLVDNTHNKFQSLRLSTKF